MKRSFILIAVSLLLLGAYSCEKPEPIVEPDENEQPGDNVQDPGTEPSDTTETPDTPDVPPTTEVVLPEGAEDPANPRVPINWKSIKAEGSDVGVTIEVTQLAETNFVFELRPGAKVQSFRMDVYPLAHLYNFLLNDKMYDKEDWEIEEQIRTYMYNTEGSGAYTFTVNDFENPEDFLQIEFDWMNTTYAPASAIVIPDCDYIIAVVGCSDASGNAQEELTLCHVHTPLQPLIGNPGCEIAVTTGFHSFSVNHILNSDAAGIYYFGGLANEIDEFIDLYGDTMMRDFVRTRLSSPVTPDEVDNLWYSFDYGQNPDSNIQSATLAVCCDANLTPQRGYSRRDFTLEEIPEETPKGGVTVDPIEERTAAAYFEFDAIFEKECQTLFYRLYSEEQKEALENASEDAKNAEAYDLILQGYGHHNPNFAYDRKSETYTGSGATVRLPQWGLGFAPGTTIYVGFTGRNVYGEPMGLTFSEPVVLDKRNTASYDNCKVEGLTLDLSKAGRNIFYYDIQYDPSTVSMVYCQYFTEDNNPGLDETNSWSEWINFIFGSYSSDSGSSEFSSPMVNSWPSLRSGRDYGAYTGMQPGTEYKFFVVAEDFDGNISNIVFDSITTAAIQVGPDPTVALDLHPYENHAFDYDWEVSFTLQHDVEYIKYTYISEASQLSGVIPDITKSKFANIKESGIPYETWIDGIYSVVLGTGNDDGGLLAYNDANIGWKGDDLVIAACVAVGRNEDGTPAYNLFHLVCEDGKATTLEEIFGIE